MATKNKKFILWFEEISKRDVLLVGGKNGSLGEMIQCFPKINIPDGFALTTRAYWHFVKFNKIDAKLREIFKNFDPKSIESLQKTGRAARALFLKAKFPEDLKKEIFQAYRKLSKKYNQENTDVAVRSSGVAEDAPRDSFAGMFETYLNVSGKENLLKAIKKCLSSTFNDRVITYRQEKGISQLKFALSVGVQKMVRSDLASSGVLFTLDTETGFKDVVLINSIFGVGEMIVKGKITPDEFYVFKPTLRKGFQSIILKNLGKKERKYIFSKKGGLKEVLVPKSQQLKFSLSDKEVLTLARWACLIEKHYKKPQDIEWAKDGKTGELFIVQSRPETVFAPREIQFYEEYKVRTTKKPILTGIAIGNKIGQGRVRIIPDVSKISQFKKGEVLVTKMTDPDWVSIFPMASAIVTDEGGPTCHAAIVSRELGIPAIVGTQKATKIFKNGELITVDCTQGKRGRIFLGKAPFKVKKYNLKKIPKLKTKIMINIGAPEIAFKSSFLPNDGVGLARIEFILAEKIRVHPLALCNYKALKSKIKSQKSKKEREKLEKVIKKIDEITVEHKDKKEYFVKELAEGIAQIAAAFYPKEVIVRFSDFKTNEYKNLIGGELFETEEANPMLGFRGACRYLDKDFQPAFKMECQAIKRVREVFGLKNVSVMIPFCRTIQEGKAVIELMKKFGLNVNLNQSKSALKVYMMCEVPSNIVLVDEFSEIFHFYSIGSNDLTQLLLGIDRDNAKIAHIADENNEAVKRAIKEFIKRIHQYGGKVGICGEAPATVPGFVEFLIECGIDSISVNPESVIKTIMKAKEAEKNIQRS